jgi:hypothetical protein
MAAATASHPEINITIVIVRLIVASSLPCCGRHASLLVLF